VIKNSTFIKKRLKKGDAIFLQKVTSEIIAGSHFSGLF
jgi:hypothetical protein